MSDDPDDDGADGADGDDGGFEFARGGYTDDGDADAGEGDSDDADAPLGDLAERARRGDVGQDEDVMDAFEEVEVGDVDEDDLWDQLEQERIEETVDEPASDAERDVRVIHKRDYCMRCQYFSAPPEVRCTHEHGEILSLEDTDRFKVADCPILRGEEELENLRR